MVDNVARVSGPAYTRLDVDERRRRLLALGADLFTQHAYDELSMARIAKHAGISKALLYHYFPSKEAYFVATLEEKAAELQERTIPDPSLPPLVQLRQDDPLGGGGAGGAPARGPRAGGDRAADRGRAQPRQAGDAGAADRG